MILQDMIARVTADTSNANTEKIVGKLNAAQDWIWNRILPMNTEILKITDDQITVASDTKSYDLNAHVSTGTLYEIQWMGVQFAGQTNFFPVQYVNGSNPTFIYWDQQDEQAVNPQYVAIDDFNEVRFAPGLPSGSVIRVDYIYKPRTLSLAQQVNCDLPDPFHEAVVSEATSLIWRMMDDTRSGQAHSEALDRLYGGINVLAKRQFQQPFATRPSSRGPARKWIMS